MTWWPGWKIHQAKLRARGARVAQAAVRI